MNKPIMEVLKENFEGWELSFNLRTSVHKAAKEEVKRKEFELKRAKQILYQTNKAKKEAQLNVKTAGRKYKSFITRRRSWAKSNYGKVLDMMEESK